MYTFRVYRLYIFDARCSLVYGNEAAGSRHKMQCRTHIMSIELNSEYSQLWTNMDIYNSRQSAHSRHIRHSVPVAVCVRQRQSILTVGWLQLNVPAQESEWARATQFRLWDIVGRRGECTGNKCTSDFFRFFFVSFTFDTQHARIFPLQLLRFFRCCRCRIIILDSFSFSFVFFVFFFFILPFPSNRFVRCKLRAERKWQWF